MNVKEFRRELGVLFGAIVLTGCSTTGGPGRIVWTELLAYCLVLAGCSGNVGVGVSVGVPVGNHGYVSVGGTRWR